MAELRTPPNVARTPPRRPTPDFSIFRHDEFHTKKQSLSEPRRLEAPRKQFAPWTIDRSTRSPRVVRKSQRLQLGPSQDKIAVSQDTLDAPFALDPATEFFYIKRKLGYGSFSDVYQAESRETGKKFALKKIVRCRDASDAFRIKRELRNYADLPPHPNIVRFYTSWSAPPPLATLQLELCAISLADLALVNHEITESVIWRVLQDLLQALAHLSSNRFIHLDVKPENIMVGLDGLYKLGDFTTLVRCDSQGAVLASELADDGDGRYMAPEVLREGVMTIKADVFSLAVSLLELATDIELPGGDILYNQLRQGEVPSSLATLISPDLNCTLSQMLQVDWRRRPSPAELLQDPVVKRHNQLSCLPQHKLASDECGPQAAVDSPLFLPLMTPEDCTKLAAALQPCSLMSAFSEAE